jgi:glycosyltransferase involved in cell wall biosynthesis
LASSADAFIFNLIDANVFKYGISSNKLFDYLAASRPIIFCCNAGNNPVAESNSGITVAPNNPEELADAIATLASLSIAERTRMGVAGFEFVKANHSFALLAKRLAVVLDDISPVNK